jgi:hypothetical protein
MLYKSWANRPGIYTIFEMQKKTKKIDRKIEPRTIRNLKYRLLQYGILTLLLISMCFAHEET